jgi:hypothetical protein
MPKTIHLHSVRDEETEYGNAVFESVSAFLEKFVAYVLHADGFTMRIN